MWSLNITYSTIFTLLRMMWDDKMPTWWDKVRWMTLWLSVRLLLIFWEYIRRRIICFVWCWVTEPWCQWSEVRSRWCPWLGKLNIFKFNIDHGNQKPQTRKQLLYMQLVWSRNCFGEEIIDENNWAFSKYIF